jgi:hypothetical protein
LNASRFENTALFTSLVVATVLSAMLLILANGMTTDELNKEKSKTIKSQIRRKNKIPAKRFWLIVLLL